ncbi:hypothetical protein CSOJ01_02655 [Colletotrichum sojae]|uniref:Uncharacterized protein n=1 Tax=Colletotrichum sojae TaxID=2175907 RepID=A0A8H6JQ47_9PEZI|nr:hypothetical protein CSOJ01_02655 [Colletotrichum sojae]
MASLQNNPLVVISSQDQLSDDGKKMCDNLLTKILARDYPFRRDLTVDDVRSKFWGLVFADDWTTAHPDPEPSVTQIKEDLATARNEYRGTCVGLLKTIAQAPSGSSSSIFAFLKAEFDLESTLNVKFKWFDEYGTPVSDNEVDSSPRRSLGLIESEVLQEWDCEDIKRVNKLNQAVVTYWGRIRLIALANGQWTEAASRANESLGVLQRPRLSRDILRDSIEKQISYLKRSSIRHRSKENLSTRDLYQPHRLQSIKSTGLYMDHFTVQELEWTFTLLKQLDSSEHPNTECHWY